MTELEQLLAMFERCGIPFQRYDNTRDACIEITVTPPSVADGDDQTGESGNQAGPLTGATWASTDYRFSLDGQLVGIWMEGD
jgi:hypothetical protein